MNCNAHFKGYPFLPIPHRKSSGRIKSNWNCVNLNKTFYWLKQIRTFACINRMRTNKKAQAWCNTPNMDPRTNNKNEESCNPHCLQLKLLNFFWREKKVDNANCLWRGTKFQSFTSFFFNHLICIYFETQAQEEKRNCKQSRFVRSITTTL